MVLYTILTNFILINIIIAISCEYFQAVLPTQKGAEKTLDFTARKEFKSIIIRLTQMGVQIPFLNP